MSLDLPDQLARTIEIQTATVHLSGEFGGAVEVPIYLGRRDEKCSELEELLLHVEGEEELLHPIRREFFCGRLRLMYFSESIQKTRRLPSGLQLCWSPSEDHQGANGMELSFRAAPREPRNSN